MPSIRNTLMGAASDVMGAVSLKRLTGRHTPYVGMYFSLQIDQVEMARFSECHLPTIQTEVREYQEGGNPGYTYRYPVRTRYSNLVLKYSSDIGMELYNWYMMTVAGEPVRQTMSVYLYDSSGVKVRAWHLVDAFPVKWVGPALRTSHPSVAVETLEIAFCAFWMEIPQDDILQATLRRTKEKITDALSDAL